MRITIAAGRSGDNGPVDPIDPGPQRNINDLFELDFLRVSQPTVRPFQEVRIEWSIRERAGSFADYIFDLHAGADVLVVPIEQAGRASFSPHETTTLWIFARHRGGGPSAFLGSRTLVVVDESECLLLEIDQSFLDGQVTEGFSHIARETGQLRLRRAGFIRPDGTIGSTERQVQPSWEPGVVKYYLPLEVVINNFFNADLDVHVEIRFLVHHLATRTDLEVTIGHSSDVDFDTVENVLSLGHSATMAKTANRLLPFILDCRARVFEREILRWITAYIDLQTGTYRLVAVRVSGAGGRHWLTIVLCPVPPPVDDGPVISGDVDRAPTRI